MVDGTIFTVLSNGTLLKPQEFKGDKIINATESNTSFGEKREKQPQEKYREEDYTQKLITGSLKKTKK